MNASRKYFLLNRSIVDNHLYENTALGLCIAGLYALEGDLAILTQKE